MKRIKLEEKNYGGDDIIYIKHQIIGGLRETLHNDKICVIELYGSFTELFLNCVFGGLVEYGYTKKDLSNLSIQPMTTSSIEEYNRIWGIINKSFDDLMIAEKYGCNEMSNDFTKEELKLIKDSLHFYEYHEFQPSITKRFNIKKVLSKVNNKIKG